MPVSVKRYTSIFWEFPDGFSPANADIRCDLFKDYAITRYAAEFINTLSSLVYSTFGIYRAYQKHFALRSANPSRVPSRSWYSWSVEDRQKWPSDSGSLTSLLRSYGRRCLLSRVPHDPQVSYANVYVLHVDIYAWCLIDILCLFSG